MPTRSAATRADADVDADTGVTDLDVDRLCAEAGQAASPDLVQVALCEVALGYDIVIADYLPVGTARQIADVRAVADLDHREARRRCAAAIRHARAQEQEQIS
jgi:hypothetical protein